MNLLKSNVMKCGLVTALFACSVSLAAAQDMESIARDLKEAQQRLTAQRESIAAEKPELGKAFEQMRASLIEKRRLARIARMAQADRDALLKGLEKKHYLSAQNDDYVDRQLHDYGLMLETFLLPG